MERTAYWILGIVVVFALVAGVFYFVFSRSGQAPATNQQTNGQTGGFPNNTSNVVPGTPSAPGVQEDKLGVASREGGSILVTDFIHNGETIEDPAAPGQYILAGELGYCLGDGTCPKAAEVSNFHILFEDKTDFFNITLLSEPLSGARLDAETFLKARLGLQDRDMCSLFYWIGAPGAVSQEYAGANLGFSFCPGATAL